MKKVSLKRFFHELTVKKLLYWLPVAIVFIALLMNAVSLLYPVLWGLNMSFKDIIAYTIAPNDITTDFHFENYTQVINILHIDVLTSVGIKRIGFWTMLQNTVIWAFFSPLPSAIVSVLVAYVIAIYRNAFTKFLFQLGILLMCLVTVGTFPATYELYTSLGMRNNRFLYIMLTANGGFSGMTFLLYYNIYKGVPKDYAEAVQLDGAGHWMTFYVVYLPNIIGLALVYYVLGVLGAWNDYNTCLIWMDQYPTLSYGVYIFQFEAKTNQATLPQIIAAFFVIAIPTIIFYLFMDKRLVASLKVTGLKG